MRNHLPRSVLVLATALLALVLAACGGGDEDAGTDLGPDPATMVPGDAPVYVEAVIEPGDAVRSDLDAALGKLLGGDDAGARIQAAIDAALADEDAGMTYAADIEPWLGRRAGAFVSSYDAKGDGKGSAAAAIAVTDPEAAGEFVDKLADETFRRPAREEYEGTELTVDRRDETWIGVSGDFLLAGTGEGVRAAIDAGAGESLADRDDAETGRDLVPDERLFSVYVDPQATLAMLEESGELDKKQLDDVREQIGEYGDGAAVAWGTASADALTLAGSGPAPEDGVETTDLLGELPADAWLALAGSDLGERLDGSLGDLQSGVKSEVESSLGGLPGAIDPADAIESATGLDPERDLSWVGDAAAFVEGSSLLGLGGGAVLEATDEAAATEAIAKLRRSLANSGVVRVSPSAAGKGFKVQPPGSPLGAEVALEDGRVIIAAGADSVDDVANPAEGLSGSDRFGSASGALGEGQVPTLFLDFAPLAELVKTAGQVSSDPAVGQATRYLSALDYLIAGSRADGDRVEARAVLGVKEPSGGGEVSTSAITAP